MMNTKEICLRAYRIATEPYRSWRRRAWIAKQQCPIVVIYYHRVADTDLTPWTITRDAFARQMDYLQANFELLRMDQVSERMEAGSNSRPAVAITFDDGYAENMDFAFPLMLARAIPCMYYVSTSQILNQTLFQHDQELGLRLQPNSIADLKQIARWGFDIGSHTRTHVDMAGVTSKGQLREELSVSRRELSQRLGVKVEHFAFPFGQRHHISDAAMAAARSAGYRTVAGAYGGYNWMGNDPFFVQRVHGDPCFERFMNWVEVDPRHAWIAPQDSWLRAAERTAMVQADADDDATEVDGGNLTSSARCEAACADESGGENVATLSAHIAADSEGVRPATQPTSTGFPDGSALQHRSPTAFPNWLPLDNADALDEFSPGRGSNGPMSQR